LGFDFSPFTAMRANNKILIEAEIFEEQGTQLSGNIEDRS
jgi:hypothetical protein